MVAAEVRWFFPFLSLSLSLLSRPLLLSSERSKAENPALCGGFTRTFKMAAARSGHVSRPFTRVAGRLQDSKSLDGISEVFGGVRARDSKSGEGRRATISSALELEGSVSHDGDLTHFVANNLQHKIKMRWNYQQCNAPPPPPPLTRSMQRLKSDIPPIDPAVLIDLEKDAQDVAQKVDLMMKSLNATVQNMTALSVGYIQTYRDSVDSLGESVDMSIKGMYTLMARCEELDRSMQPIHALAKQIREVKRTLEMFETLCK
uniref:BLOC-1 related complex subunit 6 n=1 Tax=Callorhinchus milii TaxID=7868 RepID=A0A4W3KBA7_CALMI